MMPLLLACALGQVAASDTAAWRIFAQLNPPGADHAAAWESWASAAGTFRKDGADPGSWTAVSHPGVERFELLTPAEFPNLRHIVGGRMVPLTDPIASATRLVEVRLNAVSFDFIRTRQLYTVAGQRCAVAQGPVEFPVGAIQLKAGWQPIGESERAHYHTLSVHLANGSTRLFGLAALNFAAKTDKGWLWASFEHVGGASGPYYRLVGTQTTFLNAAQQPVRLGNAVLEGDLGDSASCMTCHARAGLGINGGPPRLPVFAPAPAGVRRGYVGRPDPDWFGHTDGRGRRLTTFASLDYVWSLSQAAETPP